MMQNMQQLQQPMMQNMQQLQQPMQNNMMQNNMNYDLFKNLANYNNSNNILI